MARVEIWVAVNAGLTDVWICKVFPFRSEVAKSTSLTIVSLGVILKGNKTLTVIRSGNLR